MISAALSFIGDKDWFRVSLQDGRALSIYGEVNDISRASVTIYNEAGEYLNSELFIVDGNSLIGEIEWIPQYHYPSVYYLEFYSLDSGTGNYTIGLDIFGRG